MNIFFQIRKRRKYCGRFTDIVALKTYDFYLLFLFFTMAGEEKGAGGKAGNNFSESHLFLLFEMPVLM